MNFNKLFVATFLTIASASAFAEVKPQGTPVAYACSNNALNSADRVSTAIIKATRICMSRLSGLNQDALLLTLNDGTTQVWYVVIKQPLPVAAVLGQPKVYELTLSYAGVLIGNKVTYIGNSNRGSFKAVLTVASDTPSLMSLRGTTPGNIKFLANKFQTVYNTL